MCEGGFYFNAHNCDQQKAVTLCCPCVASETGHGYGGWGLSTGMLGRLQASPPGLRQVGGQAVGVGLGNGPCHLRTEVAAGAVVRLQHLGDSAGQVQPQGARSPQSCHGVPSYFQE